MGEIARAALAIAGFVIGGPVGFVVGSLLGGLLFPGQARPSPSDVAGLRISGPTPGAPLPLVYGTMRVRGHTIWVGETRVTKASSKKGKSKDKGGGGKKGGGGGRDVNLVTFIHALCEGNACVELKTIWEGEKVIWKDGTAYVEGLDFTFYNGTLDQPIDTRMTQKLHPGQEALSYPGVCYVYVHEWNSGATETIPQFTYEISVPVPCTGGG